MSTDLALALHNSLSKEAASITSDFMEIGLDSLLDSGIIKDIPFCSTVMSAYKIGHSIKELHYIKNLAVFVNSLNEGIQDEAKREYYKNRIKDDKYSNQEIEHLLLLLDRYVQIGKAQMLAKVYLSYLDGFISWLDCAKYSEVIDRFLPGDCEMLISAQSYKTERDIETDSIQRLIALGLVIEGFRTMAVQEENGALSIDPPELREKSERNYSRTEFGNTLVRILTGNGEENNS